MVADRQIPQQGRHVRLARFPQERDYGATVGAVAGCPGDVPPDKERDVSNSHETWLRPVQQREAREAASRLVMQHRPACGGRITKASLVRDGPGHRPELCPVRVDATVRGRTGPMDGPGWMHGICLPDQGNAARLADTPPGRPGPVERSWLVRNGAI